MSDQSTPAPDAQPQGQGADQENPTAGLYDLASAPEEYRPYIEAELKKIEGNVTRKFQEHSEFRKQWEPLADLNLTDVPREDLEALLQLNEMAKDPEAFDEWLRSVATERGILSDDAEGADVDDDDDEDLDISQLVAQAVQEALTPFQQQLQAQQQEQLVGQKSQEVEQELNDLLSQRSLELDPEDRQAVYALAANVPDDQIDTAIQQGLDAFLRIKGAGGRELVESKANQPMGSTENGTPNSGPEEIKGFDAAKKAARERLRNAGLASP